MKCQGGRAHSMICHHFIANYSNTDWETFLECSNYLRHSSKRPQLRDINGTSVNTVIYIKTNFRAFMWK